MIGMLRPKRSRRRKPVRDLLRRRARRQPQVGSLQQSEGRCTRVHAHSGTWSSRPGVRAAWPRLDETTINDQAGELDAAITARLALTITNARTLAGTELRRHFFFDLGQMFAMGDEPVVAVRPEVSDEVVWI